MMGIFKKKIKVRGFDEARSLQKIDRKSYIIHHYCPHTFNAGDHFVIRSIRQHLTRFLPGATFIPKPCAFNRGWGKPVRLTGENVNFSNRYADAVIVGGSDQYNNWSLRILPDEISKLQPPLYFIGLGVSSKNIDAPPHIEKKEYYEHIRLANEATRLSSVRDNYTRDFLIKLGYEKAVVTGCPAMYLFDAPFALNESDDVAITFPFPVVRRNNRAEFDRLLETVRLIVRLVRARGLNPIISCHDDRDVPLAQNYFPEERIFFSNYVDDFFSFYQQVKLVIGSRLHASILAAGMGKPFININLDARGKGFSDTFGLSDWNLDINDPRLERHLQDRMERLLGGDLSPLQAFYETKNGYRRIFLKFMQDVSQDIAGRLPGKG